MFAIEDELHDERIASFSTKPEAIEELRRLAGLPWNTPPNVSPCTSWRTCGRRYHVVEFDVAASPWRRISDEAYLDVSERGAIWFSSDETS